MSSTTKPAATSVDAAAVAIRIEEKLDQVHQLLLQAEEEASGLVEVLMEHQPFVRFNTALINAAGDLALAIGEVSVSEAGKQACELVELMDYANRKDG
jgi:hypothetical protein